MGGELLASHPVRVKHDRVPRGGIDAHGERSRHSASLDRHGSNGRSVQIDRGHVLGLGGLRVKRDPEGAECDAHDDEGHGDHADHHVLERVGEESESEREEQVRPEFHQPRPYARWEVAERLGEQEHAEPGQEDSDDDLAESHSAVAVPRDSGVCKCGLERGVL